jgi:hypothetical protein
MLNPNVDETTVDGLLASILEAHDIAVENERNAKLATFYIEQHLAEIMGKHGITSRMINGRKVTLKEVRIPKADMLWPLLDFIMESELIRTGTLVKAEDQPDTRRDKFDLGRAKTHFHGHSEAVTKVIEEAYLFDNPKLIIERNKNGS